MSSFISHFYFYLLIIEDRHNSFCSEWDDCLLGDCFGDRKARYRTAPRSCAPPPPPPSPPSGWPSSKIQLYFLGICMGICRTVFIYQEGGRGGRGWWGVVPSRFHTQSPEFVLPARYGVPEPVFYKELPNKGYHGTVIQCFGI